MLCPRCSEPLVNDKQCDCGWKSRLSSERPIDPNRGLCAWTDRGMRCSNPGTMCVGTTEPTGSTSGDGTRGQWYCAWHYECVTKGMNGQRNGSDYDQFQHQEMNYEFNRRGKIRDDWDENDPTLIKGLAFLGEDSLAWKKAPEPCRQKARELIASGWKPKNDIRVKGL